MQLELTLSERPADPDKATRRAARDQQVMADSLRLLQGEEDDDYRRRMRSCAVDILLMDIYGEFPRP